jgi:hypothetical protein
LKLTIDDTLSKVFENLLEHNGPDPSFSEFTLWVEARVPKLSAKAYGRYVYRNRDNIVTASPRQGVRKFEVAKL